MKIIAYLLTLWLSYEAWVTHKRMKRHAKRMNWYDDLEEQYFQV